MRGLSHWSTEDVDRGNWRQVMVYITYLFLLLIQTSWNDFFQGPCWFLARSLIKLRSYNPAPHIHLMTTSFKDNCSRSSFKLHSTIANL